MITLLLLALTLAAAIRPGVQWLNRHKVPQSLAIFIFFALGIGAFVLFFWLAMPPALHELSRAFDPHKHETGFRHDVLAWVNTHLEKVPSGEAIFHPITTYGHKATEAIVAVFFTLAATWYWVSERDGMIDLVVRLSPEEKREKARRTYLAIDQRLGAYTRLKFLMVIVIGTILSLGFWAVGLNYPVLIGGAAALFEIVPVIGPIFASLLVLAVGLPQSVHTAALALLVLIVVREFQSYVINPRVMGRSVGLSPLVTLVTVAVTGVLFGGFAVVLAIPVTSAAATLIDVLVLGHDEPTTTSTTTSAT